MAATFPLIIEQGATFSRTWVWRSANKKAINLTGYTAKLQVRDKAGGTMLFELSTENGRITIVPLTGTITLTISDEDTQAISFLKGVYDLVLSAPDGTKVRLLSGSVTVSLGVTVS